MLRPGDVVVELGCGTGLNFALLQKAVGPTGKIVGVDLTAEMLDRARRRVDANGWKNVELIHDDIANYEFASPVDGVISTFAVTLSPDYDRVISHAAAALAPGGRCVILDLKRRDDVPPWLLRFGVWITRPFGVTMEMTERRPWESISRYLVDASLKNLYFGFAYLAVGVKNIQP